MKKILKLILPMIVFGMSSCLDIIDEVTFKSDGSGTYSQTIDISGMISLYSSTFEEDTAIAETIEQYKEMVKSEAERLKKVNGVSTIKTNIDEQAGIFKISYNFNSIVALNNSIRAMQDDNSYPDEYVLKGKKFERIPISDEGIKKMFQLTDESEEESDMMAIMLSDCYYKQIFHFDRRVKSAEPYSVRAEGNTVTQETDLSDLLKKNKDLGIIIKLK